MSKRPALLNDSRCRKASQASYLYADDFLLVCTLKWLIARCTSLPLLHLGHSAMRLSWSLTLMCAVNRFLQLWQKNS